MSLIEHESCSFKCLVAHCIEASTANSTTTTTTRTTTTTTRTTSKSSIARLPDQYFDGGGYCTTDKQIAAKMQHVSQTYAVLALELQHHLR
jgi:hypothetical protein